ncbi:hypothetical protein GCM10009826_00970 [Humibacillus xanthopallidus]|nr:transposase [Humibacillus xanthopallidus]
MDVPAKLAARVRLFDTGHNRKTDALDAHSIAVVAVRTEGLRVLQVDGELEALRMLSDRREELTRLRVQTVNRGVMIVLDEPRHPVATGSTGCSPSWYRARGRRT